MKTVIGIFLTALVTSGWWYFGINGVPEKGTMVLPFLLTIVGSLLDIAILSMSVAENWD